ncbi:MAG: hypothetical protein E2O35_05300 [Proteobacteria bacterium]|nr:MAG: hypothetical protein E2O35_05300 [Pseudomonadota bacterium]
MSELSATSVTEDTELDGGSVVAKTKTINRDYLADVVSLSVVQLQSAIEYAGIHENECTGAILNVVSGVATLRESLIDTSISAPGATLLKNIELALSGLTKDTTDVITSMQFIDALSQRLSHILFE